MKQTSTKSVLGGVGDRQGIVQEIWISTYYQMVYSQNIIRRGEWETKNYLGFWYTSRFPYSGQKTRPRDNQEKKRESAK